MTLPEKTLDPALEYVVIWKHAEYGSAPGRKFCFLPGVFGLSSYVLLRNMCGVCLPNATVHCLPGISQLYEGYRLKMPT